MAVEHPEEIMLLAYVEDELGADERATVAQHLAACETCAADVAAVQHGRETLRAAPLFELPSGARERALAGLPQRAAPRSPARRWLAVAAPIAAALALVGGAATLAITTGGGDGNSGAGEDASAVDESAGDTAAGGAEGGGATTGPGPATGRAVPDARELARDLRQKGFDARVDRGTVVVRTSKKAALDRLLADYPRDAVRVRVEDP